MTYRNSYAKVDRSDFTPNLDERGSQRVDIGWYEGVLKDGRPYYLDLWRMTGGAGGLGSTVFMPSEGLEDSDARAVNTLLEESNVIVTKAPQELEIRRFVDPAGTPCLAISYVVVKADKHFVIVQPMPCLRHFDPNYIDYFLDLDYDFEKIDGFVSNETLRILDAMLDDMTRPEPRSPMAEARRAAKALAKLQPKKKKRPKRRKFRKP